MNIRKAAQTDVPAAAELACMLWPDNTAQEMSDMFSQLLSRSDAAVFLAESENQPIGFAQCQLRRDYVEGTDSSPVGYLEGIFVREEYRRSGIAKSLLAACEAWATEMGCTEFASDCELSNLHSLRFHLALGFAEANRIICFTKKIGD